MMHLGSALLAACGLIGIWTPALAQRTKDRARLVFTVSGAYIQGSGLWTVPQQPLQELPPPDTLFLNRSIKPSLGFGFSGAYFPGENLGLTADAFLIGLGYDDSCRLVAPESSLRNAEVCTSINSQDKSAAAVVLSAGGLVRIASREFISPFLRASAGLLFSNQSAVITSGTSSSNGGALLVIYDDEKRSSIHPAFALSAGTTLAVSNGYHLRAEVRDNIIGIDEVTGPTAGARLIPPHKTTFKHLFSVLLGLDIILERQRGRRY
jgi:opacity protein-like surface antigen